MKRILLPIMLIAAMFMMPMESFADRHDRPRTENRQNRGSKKDNRKPNFGSNKKHDNKKHDNKKHDNWKPGNSRPQPGYNHHKPAPAPKHYAPRPPKHHARLNGMLRHAIHGDRNAVVWQVGPDTYMVRYMRNGRYYMQELFASTGRYGTPFRVVMDGPGRWYRYGNRNHYYREDGSSLRVFLNGTPQNPWSLIPSIELNLSL